MKTREGEGEEEGERVKKEGEGGRSGDRRITFSCSVSMLITLKT